jgi:hypothetical protein
MRYMRRFGGAPRVFDGPILKAGFRGDSSGHHQSHSGTGRLTGESAKVRAAAGLLKREITADAEKIIAKFVAD